MTKFDEFSPHPYDEAGRVLASPVWRSWTSSCRPPPHPRWRAGRRWTRCAVAAGCAGSPRCRRSSRPPSCSSRRGVWSAPAGAGRRGPRSFRWRRRRSGSRSGPYVRPRWQAPPAETLPADGEVTLTARRLAQSAVTRERCNWCFMGVDMGGELSKRQGVLFDWWSLSSKRSDGF